jgi:urease accessory protein UreF
MPSQTPLSARAVAELPGELHPFLAQLGSVDGLVTLSAVATALRLPRVESLAALGQVLSAYRTQVVVAVEWPAIWRACEHAAHNETRELVALDQSLARQPALRAFAAASTRVGRSQLQKLRPLRDARVVQRYLAAVETGRAHGWHTLVFGLTVAVYSLPLRQSLLGYARQTLVGLARAAARPLRLARAECHEVLAKVCNGLPEELESVMNDRHPGPSGSARRS